MIGMLHGTVLSKQHASILLDVHDVGYLVSVPTTILSNTPLGEKLRVYTYTHVREDALELYGFASMEDLQVFSYLLSVSGIGPKTALGVFSVGNRSEILNAIMKGDVTFFTGVPRLGKKNAQKIIIELKNKVGSGEDLDLSTDAGHDDVIAALKAIGFSTQEAQEAARKLNGQGSTVEEKIKLALKYLGR